MLKRDDVKKDIKNGKNLDAYVALLIALFGGVISALGQVDTKTAVLILFVPVIWMVTYLVEILRNSESADRQIAALADRIDRKDVTAEFIAANIRSANKLSILSLTNYRFLAAHNSEFTALIRRGGILRVIQGDGQDPHLAEIAVLRDPSRESDFLRTQEVSSQGKLRSLAKAAGAGHVLAKKIPYATAHTLTWLEFTDRPGIVITIPTGFGQQTDHRPMIAFSEAEDATVYRYYTEYFENLWNWPRATEIDLAAEAT